MIRSAGAGASAAGGATPAGGGGAAACAHNGTADPPSTVPTISSALARLKLFNLEITRSRLLCNGAAASGRHAPVRPAPTLLANQALKPIPEPKRAEIVDRCENEQGKNRRKSASECPIQCFRTERAAPSRFDGIEEQVATIQHRNWQQVDESEIN